MKSASSPLKSRLEALFCVEKGGCYPIYNKKYHTFFGKNKLAAKEKNDIKH